MKDKTIYHTVAEAALEGFAKSEVAKVVSSAEVDFLQQLENAVSMAEVKQLVIDRKKRLGIAPVVYQRYERTCSCGNTFETHIESQTECWECLTKGWDFVMGKR